MVGAVSFSVSSDGAVLPALGWGALNLLAALGVSALVHEVEGLPRQAAFSVSEPIGRRLVQYLGGPTAATREAGGEVSPPLSLERAMHFGSVTPAVSGTSSALASWLALLLLIGGVAAGLSTGYDRWSQAGSLEPVGLAALISGIYAGALVVAALADRLLTRFWALREGVALASVAAALAATLAVALVELGRYEDARVFRNPNAVSIGGPAFRSFVRPTDRVVPSWRAVAPVAVSSFDVGVRVAGPSRPLGARRLWLRRTSRTQAAWSTRPGYTYCFAARSRSRRYGVSPWSRERCLTVPLDDRALARRGRWRSLSGRRFFSSTLTQTDQKGAALTRVVSARRLALVALRCRACGAVHVYLGRKRVARVDLRSGGRPRIQILPVATWSRPRHGLLKVIAVSPGRTVAVDGLAVSLLPPPAP